MTPPRTAALALAAMCALAGAAAADQAAPTAGAAPHAAGTAAAPAAPTAAGAPADEPAAPLPSSSMSVAPRELPRFDDRERVALPPLVLPHAPPGPDRRPMYVGAGLIVLGAVFWWNRRRRDRFDREDGGAPVRRPRAPRRVRDDDADDLHAAARGDSSEAPDAAAATDAAAPERPDPP